MSGVSGESDLVVLLGHEIGYSASPAMHNAAFATLGIDARYEVCDTPAERLATEVEALRADGRLGANVTKPHKVAVCELVDELAPEVARLGAANTIVRHSGRLVAHNTDLAAVIGELRELLAAPAVHVAVVLGAGGASRAVQSALAELGVERIQVLTRESWQALPDAVASAGLLANATPIGTASDDSPVPPALLRADLAVLDLVYRPSPTRLVRDALAVGAPARGGAGMLLRQAAASFALWTHREAPVDVMRAALDAELDVAAHA